MLVESHFTNMQRAAISVAPWDPCCFFLGGGGKGCTFPTNRKIVSDRAVAKIFLLPEIFFWAHIFDLHTLNSILKRFWRVLLKGSIYYILGNLVIYIIVGSS
jgi:hypothetical protein